MLNKIRGLLNGKKTYLSMVILIIEAVINYSADGDLMKLITKITEAIGIMTLRAGVAKSGTIEVK